MPELRRAKPPGGEGAVSHELKSRDSFINESILQWPTRHTVRCSGAGRPPSEIA